MGYSNGLFKGYSDEIFRQQPCTAWCAWAIGETCDSYYCLPGTDDGSGRCGSSMFGCYVGIEARGIFPVDSVHDRHPVDSVGRRWPTSLASPKLQGRG